MKTFRVEFKTECISVVEAEAFVESNSDYRFLAGGFIVAQFPKGVATKVAELPVNSEELRHLLKKSGEEGVGGEH